MNCTTPGFRWLCTVLFSFDFSCQLNTLSEDIMNMQISYFVAEIGTSTNKSLIFHVIFFNKYISVTTLDITMKFSVTALHIHSEGSVSQIFLFMP